jgi:hypothetical protein
MVRVTDEVQVDADSGSDFYAITAGLLFNL